MEAMINGLFEACESVFLLGELADLDDLLDGSTETPDDVVADRLVAVAIGDTITVCVRVEVIGNACKAKDNRYSFC